MPREFVMQDATRSGISGRREPRRMHATIWRFRGRRQIGFDACASAISNSAFSIEAPAIAQRNVPRISVLLESLAILAYYELRVGFQMSASLIRDRLASIVQR
jgi:hypothetical protein